jgi:hypothetical protein
MSHRERVLATGCGHIQTRLAFLRALEQFEDHRERGPVRIRQTVLQSDRAVAMVLSMGLVVRSCFQCSARKS